MAAGSARELYQSPKPSLECRQRVAERVGRLELPQVANKPPIARMSCVQVLVLLLQLLSTSSCCHTLQDKVPEWLT